MKIEDNRRNPRTFGDLIVGDVFTSDAKVFYMKTEKSYNEGGMEDSKGHEFNAVCISEKYAGTKVSFRPSEKVIFLNDATLVLN